MIFALLVCAFLLVLVLYFAALMVSEVALWFVNRVSQRQEAFSPSITARH